MAVTARFIADPITGESFMVVPRGLVDRLALMGTRRCSTRRVSMNVLLPRRSGLLRAAADAASVCTIFAAAVVGAVTGDMWPGFVASAVLAPTWGYPRLMSLVRSRRRLPFDADRRVKAFRDQRHRVASGHVHEGGGARRDRGSRRFADDWIKLQLRPRGDLPVVVTGHMWRGDVLRIPYSWWRAVRRNRQLTSAVSAWARNRLVMHESQALESTVRLYCHWLPDGSHEACISELRARALAEEMFADEWAAVIDEAATCFDVGRRQGRPVRTSRKRLLLS